eukprot:2249524-Rhodomonas_salina.1
MGLRTGRGEGGEAAPEGREVAGLPELNFGGRNREHLVADSARGRAVGGRGVVGRELRGARDEVRGELAHEDRACLEVDALVLEAHDDGPRGLVDLDRKLPRALHDHVLDDLVHFAAVLGDLAQVRPRHLVLGQIVPRHLVDAGLHDLLHVLVDAIGEQASDAELVDVEACHVAVVEDKGVPELVPGRALEDLSPLRTFGVQYVHAHAHERVLTHHFETKQRVIFAPAGQTSKLPSTSKCCRSSRGCLAANMWRSPEQQVT